MSLEQIESAMNFALYSLKEHHVSNIWDPHQPIVNNDIFWNQNKKQDFMRRFIGTLGEIAFADYYNLPRPAKSFGAVNGQDYGSDFHFFLRDRSFVTREIIVDLKTMRRDSYHVKKEYVQNLSEYTISRIDSLTGLYFSNTLIISKYIENTFHLFDEQISFNFNSPSLLMLFSGYINKADILKNAILFPANTIRTRGNIQTSNSTFSFTHATYEIMFKHLSRPWLVPNKKVKIVNLK